MSMIHVPHVEVLMRPVRPIVGDQLVAQVLDFFKQQEDLLAVPVVDDGRYVGIITRKCLFQRLSQPFFMEVHQRKPIRVLLEQPTLITPAHTPIDTALQELLARDPRLVSDAFVIQDAHQTYHIAYVSDLMMQIATMQSSLIAQLRAMSQRIQNEVAHARDLQYGLLPPADLQVAHTTLSGRLATSTEVGGDFYDYFLIGQHALGLLVGDVSGHGVAAGAVVTAAKASLATLQSLGCTEPTLLLSQLNRALLATTSSSLLMTCCYGVVNFQEQTFCYANAGHPAPLLYRSTNDTLLHLTEATGFPLGLDEHAQYVADTITLQPGDRLLLYSDGLIEGCDPQGRPYDYPRLEANVREHGKDSPGKITQQLLDDLKRYCAGRPLEDDVAIVVMDYQQEVQL